MIYAEIDVVELPNIRLYEHKRMEEWKSSIKITIYLINFMNLSQKTTTYSYMRNAHMF